MLPDFSTQYFHFSTSPLFHFSTFTLHSLPLALTPSLRTGRLFPTAVNAILAEIRQAQARGQSVVSLMRGEPDFDTPPHVIEAAARAMRAGRTRYPDNRGEVPLREAIAAKLARDNGATYDPATEVLVTTGATLGIYVALMAIVNPGDEVLVPDPIYDAYRSPIELAGGCVKPVRSTIANDRFAITADAIESALSPSSKVLLLNTPWNPVGTVLRRDELQALAEVVLRNNLVLISDEIYEAITYGGNPHCTGVAGPGTAGADGCHQQLVEDVCDDRLAGRILRGSRADRQRDVPVPSTGEPGTGDVHPGRGGSRAVGIAGCGWRDAG